MSDPLLVDVYEGDLGGHPDWPKLVEAGYPWIGAGLKASEGLYASPWFVVQWQKLVTLVPVARVGVDWWQYAYHYARVADDAIKQAHVFLGNASKAGIDLSALWSMVDVESANNPEKPGRAHLEDWVSTFAAEILKETGRKPTLYGNVYLAENGVQSTCGCDTLIVARYSQTLPPVIYNRIGWTWSAEPDVEPPTLLGWQGVGDGLGYWSQPTLSPLGKVDITAVVVANGGQTAMQWLQHWRG